MMIKEIERELVRDFAFKVYDTCCDIIKEAQEFMRKQGDKRIKSFYKYPVSSVKAFFENPYLDEEDKESISYYKYSVIKYHRADIPEDMYDYHAIFDGYQSEKVKIEDNSSFIKLKDWVEKNPDILEILKRGEERDCKFILHSLIQGSVERFLFLTNATDTFSKEDEEALKDIIQKRLSFYLDSRLYIDICIPICLLTFERDTISLSDGVEIVKIEEKFQKARQMACEYEVVNEDWVAACATHMIILHNWSYENSYDFSVNYSMQDYNAYPLDRINGIIGIIRAVTGYITGYEQILSMPINWMCDTYADLPVLYGSKSHFVSSEETKKNWMNLNIQYVDAEKCDRIAEYYSKYLKNEAKIQFAMSRFNRCMLRESVDDMSTDACIGLEALLVGGTRDQISYTISNRIPVVIAKSSDSCDYASENSRSIMKKIYNYRSRIVHGGKLKENEKYVKINDKEVFIPDIAVDYLRITLLFMMENPEFLEPEKFDEYIDSKVCGCS